MLRKIKWPYIKQQYQPLNINIISLFICGLCFAVVLFGTNALIASDYYSNEYMDTKIVLFPIQESTVSSLVDSFIYSFNFKEGQEFQKGDILVKLDKKLYQQFCNKTKAELSGASASYKYAESIYKYNIILFQKNAISSQELEKSELDKIQAYSNYQQAKANMFISDLKLKSCSIKAPFAGRITNKEINEYDYVRTGQPILKIINDNQLLAIMNLPSSYLNKIKHGMEIKFKIDETGNDCIGKIYEIAGSINPSSRTFEIKAIIDNKDRKLLAGMSGKLMSTFK